MGHSIDLLNHRTILNVHHQAQIAPSDRRTPSLPPTITSIMLLRQVLFCDLNEHLNTPFGVEWHGGNGLSASVDDAYVVFPKNPHATRLLPDVSSHGTQFGRKHVWFFGVKPHEAALV